MGRFSVLGVGRCSCLALAVALGLGGAAAAQGPEPAAPQAEPVPAPSPPASESAEPTERVVITPPEVPYTRARVTHEPSSREINDLYPETAAREDIGGRAVVICEIAASQRLVNCAITEETPRGWGFGAAVLQIAALYRVAPPIYGGEVVRDAKFKIPMTFTMASAPAPAEAPRPSGRTLETGRGREPVDTAVFTPAPDPPEETPAQRLKRLGPLRRSDGVLWAPIGFALLTLAGVVWGLWPVRRGRRVSRPADQRA